MILCIKLKEVFFFFFGVVSHEYQKFISSLINPKFKSLPIHLSGKLVN
jgi:hypothetical protein